jgi:rubredoxin
MQELAYKKWQCFFCGLIYDEAEGLPEEGLAPGTRWEDIPAEWVCPSCGAGKSDFAMMEIDA